MIIPSIGRIATGNVEVDKNGVDQPIALNHYILTTLFKENGDWKEHPIADRVRTVQNRFGEDKRPLALQSVPVKLLFNDNSLNLRTQYELWGNQGLRCTGNGKTCHLLTTEQTMACPGPAACKMSLQSGAACESTASMNLIIDVPMGEGIELDPLDNFLFRTRSVTTRNALAFRLMAYKHMFGTLRGLPLNIVLRGKSSANGNLYFFTDLALRGSMQDCKEAVAKQAQEDESLHWRDFEEELLQLSVSSNQDDDILSEGYYPILRQENSNTTPLSISQTDVASDQPVPTLLPEIDPLTDNIETLFVYSETQEDDIATTGNDVIGQVMMSEENVSVADVASQIAGHDLSMEMPERLAAMLNTTPYTLEDILHVNTMTEERFTRQGMSLASDNTNKQAGLKNPNFAALQALVQ